MIPYADSIHLFPPYTPATGDADVEAVIEAILEDPASRQFIHNYAVPEASSSRRKWIQAALTVRPAEVLPENLSKLIDRLLQHELSSKDITEASELSGFKIQGLEGEKICIWNGDITTLKIGAITNAANAGMLGCFQPFHACIDNAIHCAAGPQLREDCNCIIQLQEMDEPTGSAKITRAYNLPSDFVLHTVGPIVINRDPTDRDAQQLADCYRSCLTLANEAGVISIAFCGISTGVFGYPQEQAVHVALRAVIDWLSDHPGRMQHIVFNTYGEAATHVYNSAIENYL